MEDKIRSLMEKFAIDEEEARDLLGETINSLEPEDNFDVQEESIPEPEMSYDQDMHDAMESDINMQVLDSGSPGFVGALAKLKEVKANTRAKKTKKTADLTQNLIEAIRTMLSGERVDEGNSSEFIQQLREEFPDVMQAIDSGDTSGITEDNYDDAFSVHRKTLEQGQASTMGLRSSKIALDTLNPTSTPSVDPNKDKSNSLYTNAIEQYGSDPNVDETAIQQAVGKVDQLDKESNSSMTDEERNEHLKFFLNKSDQNAAVAYLKNASKNFGAKEGQYVRSRFNPNYFKNVTSGQWYEINLEKVAEDEEVVQSPQEAPPSEEAPTSESFSLEETEKQRLSQLLTDAAMSGVSPYHLMGTVAGFLGDRRFGSIPSSETERTDFQNGYREGGVARGGGQATASKRLPVG